MAGCVRGRADGRRVAERRGGTQKEGDIERECYPPNETMRTPSLANAEKDIGGGVSPRAVGPA